MKTGKEQSINELSRDINAKTISHSLYCPIEGVFEKIQYTGSAPHSKIRDAAKIMHDVFTNSNNRAEFENNLENLKNSKIGFRVYKKINDAKNCRDFFLDLLDKSDVIPNTEIKYTTENGYVIRGVPDKIFQEEDGSYITIEVKTGHQKQEGINQLKAYLYLMNLNNIRSNGCIIFLKDDTKKNIELSDRDTNNIKTAIKNLEELISNPSSFSTFRKDLSECVNHRCQKTHRCYGVKKRFI